ncbi:MAG: heavy-metal-associated domain-containing protein [Gemmatimonadetes bacterium]|nr:heavy-metal-associated domain-containing protein [Gemmatimonadota bacterium]
MKRFATAAAVMLVLGGLPRTATVTQGTQEPQQAAVTAGPQRIDMVVLGLSCPFCAYGLEKKLKKVEGLTDISIDFKTGKVRMAVRDGSKVSDERLKKLVKDAGFEVEEISRSPLPESGATEEGNA